MPDIQAHPAIAQVDVPLTIRASGLPPRKEFVIKSLMNRFMEHSWSAHAAFVSDEHGAIEVATAPSLRGTYRGIDRMGLLWSMSPVSGSKFRNYLPTTLEELQVEFSIEDNESVLATTIANRRFLAAGVTRTDIRDSGVVGTLFRPAAAASVPAVITLAGSGGGISEPAAALLSAHGFATLALAYIGIEHLPSRIIDIPLEYCHQAVAWMRRQTFVQAGRIGLFGQSRGGELALLIASSCPDIRAVVAYATSGVAWNATETAGREPVVRPSSWTLKGEPLPFMTNNRDAVDWNARPVVLSPSYRSMLGNPEIARSEIAVEGIRGPLLMVSGLDDHMWPSAELASIAAERLKRNGSQFACEHLTYPNAGHVLNVPYLPTTLRKFNHPVRNIECSLGGTPEGDAYARHDSWPKTISFFQQHLAA